MYSDILIFSRTSDIVIVRGSGGSNSPVIEVQEQQHVKMIEKITLYAFITLSKDDDLVECKGKGKKKFVCYKKDVYPAFGVGSTWRFSGKRQAR